MVGVYAIAGTVALLAFNLVWGSISDRRGNRLVMHALAAGQSLTSVLALVIVGLVAVAPHPAPWYPYLAVPLFFLASALKPAAQLSGSLFMLEMAPEKEQALYLGLSNTLMGLVSLISGLGGLVVDLVGFGGLFALSLALNLASFVLARGLPEPRETSR
jgi:MFS family permease